MLRLTCLFAACLLTLAGCCRCPERFTYPRSQKDVGNCMDCHSAKKSPEPEKPGCCGCGADGKPCGCKDSCSGKLDRKPVRTIDLKK